MKLLKHIFDFYINSSLHVSLATSSLVLMTYYFAKLPIDYVVFFFVFFGTVFSYNTIKYGSFVLKKHVLKKSLRVIIGLSLCSLVLCFYLFLKLNFLSQFTAFIFGLLCLLYMIPFGKKKTNLRNLAGIKIYIVSFCWAGVTLLIPLLNANIPIEYDVFFKFMQRFVLVLILILIFEINDLKYDEIQLKTVPQIIGIINTKRLIYFLLIVFYALEFFKKNLYQNQWLVNLILVSITFLFTYFASQKKSKYYTLFWVESIPLVWYALILIF